MIVSGPVVKIKEENIDEEQKVEDGEEEKDSGQQDKMRATQTTFGSHKKSDYRRAGHDSQMSVMSSIGKKSVMSIQSKMNSELRTYTLHSQASYRTSAEAKWAKEGKFP